MISVIMIDDILLFSFAQQPNLRIEKQKSPTSLASWGPFGVHLSLVHAKCECEFVDDGHDRSKHGRLDGIY